MNEETERGTHLPRPTETILDILGFFLVIGLLIATAREKRTPHRSYDDCIVIDD
jgi:hypothetical protein